MRDSLLPLVRLKEVLEHKSMITSEVQNQVSEKYHLEQLRLYEQAKSEGTTVRQTLSFSVLKIGMQRFGLIVDEIMGSEEIVVKPMHPSVNNLAIYSGATVMGDGKVALILDVQAIGKHANVSMESKEDLEKSTVSNLHDSTNMTVLRFRSGENEYFATELSSIRRIEKVDVSLIEKIGNKEFINFSGVLTLVARLDDYLNVSEVKENEQMFLLLYKNSQREFGILISEILEVVSVPFEMDMDSLKEDGIFGTQAVNGFITIFLDAYSIAQRIEKVGFAAN
ncbi:chemotaxis protein CheW [bacterium]|nr:chemotaxis protein CheW [bacterium]